jgi:hypothetical protein
MKMDDADEVRSQRLSVDFRTKSGSFSSSKDGGERRGGDVLNALRLDNQRSPLQGELELNLSPSKA